MSGQFTPIEGGFTPAYHTDRMRRGIMPTAAICLTNPETGYVYSFVNPNRRPSGLPTVDLGRMNSSDAIERYVRKRLEARFGLVLPRSSLEPLPVESAVSPYMDTIGNKQYPNIHNRQFFPVVGQIAERPQSDRLLAVPREDVISGVVMPLGSEVLNHLVVVHEEIVADYAL